jgi:hypothetical protein
MALEPERVKPGYTVYAHHTDPQGHSDPGRYVGTVEHVLEQHGVHYLQVRSGTQGGHDLFLPLATIREVEGTRIHLRLSREELAGRAWHTPPSAG